MVRRASRASVVSRATGQWSSVVSPRRSTLALYFSRSVQCQTGGVTDRSGFAALSCSEEAFLKWPGYFVPPSSFEKLIPPAANTHAEPRPLVHREIGHIGVAKNHVTAVW